MQLQVRLSAGLRYICFIGDSGDERRCVAYLDT